MYASEYIQRYHKLHRVSIYTQDTISTFFRGGSVANRGTLYNIKEVFNHRSVSSDVMNNFDHVWDLVQVYILIISSLTLDLTVKIFIIS
jgi:hypothetical protein